MDEEFVPAESDPRDSPPQVKGQFAPPFGARHQHPDSGVKTVLIIVGCVIVAVILLCGGAGIFAWFSMQNAAAPVATVTILPSSETSSADFERFSSAMTQRISSSTDSTGNDVAVQVVRDELKTWLTAELEKAIEPNQYIPFDNDLFHKAVMESSFAKRMPSSSKLNAKRDIPRSFWYPVIENRAVIVGIDVGDSGGLAVAHIMEFGNGNNPDCYQFFLARVGSEWRIYDWRDLDYGRRKSDEYANFYHQIDRANSIEYDNVLRDLGRVYKETDVYDDTSKMIEALRVAENTRCLPEDDPEKCLNVAWYYRSISEEDKAREILEPLVGTTVATGALATLADVYFHDGKFAEAASAAERLNTLVPEHPSAHFQLARSLTKLGQHVQAAHHCLALLRLDPDNHGYLSRNWYETLEQDGVDELVRLIAASGCSELIERDIGAWIKAGWWDQAVAQRVQTAIRKSELAAGPAGLLVEAKAASFAEDNSSAVELFSRAIDLATTTSLKDTARQLRREVLIESNDFERLFQLEPDHDRLAMELLDGYVDETLYFDMAKLAVELESGIGQQLDKPFGKLLLANAYEHGDDARAAVLFEEFLEWAKMNPDGVAAWDEDGWRLETVNEQCAGVFLRTHQYLKVMDRWSADTAVLWDLLQYCSAIQDQSQLDEIFCRARDNGQIPVWMIHALSARKNFLAGDQHQCLSELEKAVCSVADGEETVWVRSELSGLHGQMAVVIRDVSILERDSAALDSHFFASLTDAIIDSRDIALATSVLASFNPDHFNGSEPNKRDLQRLSAMELDEQQQLVNQAQLAIDWMNETDRDDLEWENLRDDALAKTILAGRKDDILQWKQDSRPGELQIPVMADLHIVAGDYSALSKTLDGFDDREIATWLGSDRVWSYKSLIGPIFDDLVQKHGIFNRQRQFREYFSILQSDETPVKIDNIVRALADQFENVGTPDEFVSGTGKGWTIEIPGHGRVVVLWRAGGLDGFEAWPSELKEVTNGGKSILMIGFHGGRTGEFRQLFSCLPKIVNPQSLACYDANSLSLWINNDKMKLADQLQWKNRLPIEHAVTTGHYFYATNPNDFGDVNQRILADELEKQLEGVDDGVPAQFLVSLGFADEIIPARIRSHDRESYSVEIVTVTASKLRPEMKAGTRVNTGLYDLYQTKQ